MDPIKVINVFTQWLQYNRKIFLPTVWQNLPKLEESLSELEDDQLFPIAHTISKWCAKYQLLEKLKQEVLDYDNNYLPEDNLEEIETIEDYIQLLYRSILNCYNDLAIASK